MMKVIRSGNSANIAAPLESKGKVTDITKAKVNSNLMWSLCQKMATTGQANNAIMMALLFMVVR